MRSCLFSLWSKFHPCRPSFLKRGGQVWAFVLSGAQTKDGLYPLWACGHGPIGLANGPIGLARPYLIFYPLQVIFLGIVETVLSFSFFFSFYVFYFCLSWSVFFMIGTSFLSKTKQIDKKLAKFDFVELSKKGWYLSDYVCICVLLFLRLRLYFY